MKLSHMRLHIIPVPEKNNSLIGAGALDPATGQGGDAAPLPLPAQKLSPLARASNHAVAFCCSPDAR